MFSFDEEAGAGKRCQKRQNVKLAWSDVYFIGSSYAIQPHRLPLNLWKEYYVDIFA